MLPQAPAISVARSVQAVGKACPSLVGRHKGMRDQNATRDVTALLVKSGMSMNVKRDTLAPSQQSIYRPAPNICAWEDSHQLTLSKFS